MTLKWDKTQSQLHTFDHCTFLEKFIAVESVIFIFQMYVTQKKYHWHKVQNLKTYLKQIYFGLSITPAAIIAKNIIKIPSSI